MYEVSELIKMDYQIAVDEINLRAAPFNKKKNIFRQFLTLRKCDKMQKDQYDALDVRSGFCCLSLNYFSF